VAVDPELVGRVRTAATHEAIARRFEIREKHMFGGLEFMLNGKMACGVISDELMVRVGPDAYEASLTKPHARPMDFTGRPMRGYVFIAAGGCATQATVNRWVARSATHIEELTSKRKGSAQQAN
jgi:TfoX/Sxy family transcriptional regulator of competence genes